MDLHLKWLPPFMLFDGGDTDFIFNVADFYEIPEVAGIYVFSRVHSGVASPLYIGKALNLQRRVGQHLTNNVRLMKAIGRAPKGYRTLHVAELQLKPGQKAEKALGIIESALISAALVEGYELINVHGTKTLVHSITSSGNREARTWLPEKTIKLRSA